MQNTESLRNLVHDKIVPFMKSHGLVAGSLKTSVGDSASIKCDKHGYFHVKITTKEDVKIK